MMSLPSSSGQQPTSPSQRQYRQPYSGAPSPTTPTYMRAYSLDEVRDWTDSQVGEWLSRVNLGQFGSKFQEHNIDGSVLLDLDNEALKDMEIRTVGERVRIAVAIKTLQQECYTTSAMIARTQRGGSDVGYTQNSSYVSLMADNQSKKSTPIRSNSISRFLQRSDSRKPSRTDSDSKHPTVPPSPITKRNSFEGGIMSMEKVKQTCVKVFGEDGQTRIVNVHGAKDAKTIMAKVLHKFSIDETQADDYCIFVGSGASGEARTLSDEELIDICKSVDRPEKERLILRKRHKHPTHRTFKQKGYDTTPQKTTHWPDKQTTLDIITGSPLPAGRPPSVRSVQPPKSFFGERPPSEIISSNLPSFFPNHKPEILETANVRRLSTASRLSTVGKPGPYNNVRNSILPELVSVLGVIPDKFEEENEEEYDYNYDDEDDDDDDDEEDEDEEDEENSEVVGGMPTFPEPPRQESVLQKRTSSLMHSDSNADARRPTATEQKKPSPVPEIDENVLRKLALSTPKVVVEDAPVDWMKGALIGRGTFGAVYLGLNQVSGELMAVKQVELPAKNSASEDRKKTMVEALEREIKLLKDMQHENIVQYLGSQSDDVHFSIFLEYVPGGSVAGLLASYGAFQEPLVNSFVRQILNGLSYLHGKDIIHRDIKGANVLVDNKGIVKITDFGISKKVDDSSTDIKQIAAAHRPSLQGSIFWMAPEVVKQTDYTLKADIWSLGCMVVEMFTGDHPFPDMGQMQAMFQIGSKTAPSIPNNISEHAKNFLGLTFKLEHKERPTASELLEHPFLNGNEDTKSAPM